MRKLFVFLLACITLLLLLFFGFVYTLRSDPEIGSKHEYGVLQAVSSRNKDTLKKNEYRIISKDGLIILGLKSKTDDKNAWILLNPKFIPLVKTLGDNEKNDFYITCRNYLEIVSAQEVILPVRQYLANHVDLSSCGHALTE